MNIEQIKTNKTCLDYLGKPLKKTSSGWHVYRCPWKDDLHPSLTVSPDGRVWRDLSSGLEGGIVELVQTCLNTKDFKAVCAAFDPSSSFSMSKTLDGKKEKEIECSTFASFEVFPLQSRGLYAYLTSRRINTSIARQFLKEAHYSFEERTDGRYLYALAYGNDLGGYELRSERFKGGTSPKGITTHLRGRNAASGLENGSCVVFEGFMDMLSFATMCGEVRHDYVVLNSIVNAQEAIDALQNYSGRILLCLDNDEGGSTTTSQMLQALPGATDIRSKIAPFKDVNDYLINNVKTK